MNLEDYNEYYIQGSGHYLIPKDVFDELFNEMENWKEEAKELNQKYLNAVADYETTMFEKEQLNSLVNSCQEEIRQLKKQLDYLRSGEYYNQLRFENEMLQQVVDTNGVPSEVYDYIDCIHRNTELLKENQELKDLIDTILNFSFFKEECPLNFSFEDNSKEDKAQDVFYEDEYCENACNDDYRKCWLKYFKKLQELEKGSDK